MPWQLLNETRPKPNVLGHKKADGVINIHPGYPGFHAWPSLDLSILVQLDEIGLSGGLIASAPPKPSILKVPV